MDGCISAAHRVVYTAIMPELPEVETIARGLHKRLAGARITDVWIGNKTNLLKSPARQIARVLTGARIAAFRRVGKHIVCDLDSAEGPAQWIIHLGMTGRCLICEPAHPTAPHTHLVATLASHVELRFVDPRRFGKLQVIKGHQFQAPGQEPTTVDEEAFVRLFKGRNTPIKSALLNQSLDVYKRQVRGGAVRLQCGVILVALVKEKLQRVFVGLNRVVLQAAGLLQGLGPHLLQQVDALFNFSGMNGHADGENGHNAS